MSNAQAPKVADWIKANSNMTRVTKELGVTRPTAYKYVESYDSGNIESVPEKVREYFEMILSQDISLNVNELSKLEAKLRETRDRLEELTAEQLDLIGQCVELEKKLYGNTFTMKDEGLYGSLKERLRSIDIRISKDEESIADLSKRIATFKDVGAPTLNFRSAYKIQSKCYMEDGKCTVVHNGEYYFPNYQKFQGYKFVLYLYTTIDSEFVRIGTYECEKGRNFFVIDDAPFSAPLYYMIVRLDGIYDESDFEAGEYTTDINYTTGMCELKQKK